MILYLLNNVKKYDCYKQSGDVKVKSIKSDFGHYRLAISFFVLAFMAKNTIVQ
jgi:hypothetical protein